MVLEVSWRALSDNPNDPAAIANRDGVLQAAFTIERRSRGDYLVDCCRGQRVLNIGCANHNFAPIPGKTLLHGRLAEVAAEIVGVDFEPAAVKAMNKAGYDVIEADISGDVGEVLARGRFDVVVAGELIEHLDTPLSLFRFASQMLHPDGILVLTTPNPFSPIRARRGARRQTWENVDHVAYYPPTAVAELAERAGMRLTTATTVGGPPSRGMLRRTIKRRLTRSADDLSLLEILIYRLRGRSGQLGETAIYVVAAPR
jgi:2-polyprenyl-3-methyl-5-hydroxy-6-metoxy-1,4-benzoquinol methylase